MFTQRTKLACFSFTKFFEVKSKNKFEFRSRTIGKQKYKFFVCLKTADPILFGAKPIFFGGNKRMG